MDKFIKHKLKIKYYLRYTDDFVIVNKNVNYLNGLILQISNFLKHQLKLSLHPDKIILRKLNQGIDFLGYVILPYHKVLRTKTKRRMFENIENKKQMFQQGKINRKSFEQTAQSYFGLLEHCNSKKFKEELRKKLIIIL